MTEVAVILIVLAAAVIAAGTALYMRLRVEERLAARIADVQRGLGMGAGASLTSPGQGLLRPVAVIGGLIARSGLLSSNTLADLQVTLNSTGLRGSTGLSVFVGAKLLSLIGLPAGVMLLLAQMNWWPTFWIAFVGAAAIGGLLLPDFVIRNRRKAYLAQLDQGLPDALDMLVICSEAGLGLEAAFDRVGSEIGQAHPVVALEMQATLQEMRIMVDRREALIGLGRRTGLESLRRLASTLVQTMQFGTPLSQALRTLSVEMRQEMLTRFEGRAARLPVLLTLPMILFILPCVFLVVGGPAAVQLLHSVR